MSHVLKIVGKKLNADLLGYLTGGVCGIYIGISGISNTFLIHQYQTIFQACNKNSKPVDVPDAVEQRFRQVLDDLKMDEVDKTLSRTFMSIRPDLHHIGLSGSNYSFRIGLPLNFAYNSPEDINPNMKIESKFVDWNSAEGKSLLESLVLSEKAQKFVLAQEVLKCSLSAFYLQLSFPTLCLGVLFFLGVKGNEVYQVHRKPLQARTVFYSGLCIFAYGLYILLADQTNQFMERSSLQVLSSLGKDYIEGGIEYFDKQLKMNKALRNLLHDGQSTYAVSGNYNFFIRQKSLPLTVQKSLLEEDLRKLDPSAVEESLDLL